MNDVSGNILYCDLNESCFFSVMFCIEILINDISERTLEDHELVTSVQDLWVDKEHSHNRFLFEKDFTKYAIFQNPAVNVLYNPVKSHDIIMIMFIVKC